MKWGVLTMWHPYEVFYEKEVAESYRRALWDIGICSFLEEIPDDR